MDTLGLGLQEKSRQNEFEKSKSFEEIFGALLTQHKEMVEKDSSALEVCKKNWEEYIDQVLLGSEERERDGIRAKADELIREYFPESSEDE